MKQIAFFALIMGITSCSMKIHHHDGSVTYLGAVNLREGSAGQLPLIHSKRAGVLIDLGRNQNGATIGYDNRLIVRPPGDALTSVNYQTGSDPLVNIFSAAAPIATSE